MPGRIAHHQTAGDVSRRLRRGEPGGAKMLFMVVERFKDRDPAPIYQRLRESGRSMPEGLRYVDSWIEANFDRCFQLMECDDPRLLMQWILQWRDLMEFEVVPVSPSRDVRGLFGAGCRAGVYHPMAVVRGAGGGD
jgi:hypothetical protein